MKKKQYIQPQSEVIGVDLRLLHTGPASVLPGPGKTALSIP